jgi:hypothetical protein
VLSSASAAVSRSDGRVSARSPRSAGRLSRLADHRSHAGQVGLEPRR